MTAHLSYGELRTYNAEKNAGGHYPAFSVRPIYCDPQDLLWRVARRLEAAGYHVRHPGLHPPYSALIFDPPTLSALPTRMEFDPLFAYD